MFRCKDIAEAFLLSKRPGSNLSPRGTGCYWLLRRFASLIYFVFDKCSPTMITESAG